MERVLVLGCGIAGIACARDLNSRGFEVTVIEKSRSFGGRLATRKWNGHIVDHGPPMLNLGSGNFWAAAQKACPEMVRELEVQVIGGDALPLAEAYHYHVQGNNRLAKALLQGSVEVRQQCLVEKLHRDGNEWVASGSQEAPFEFRGDKVVLALTERQTHDLLQASALRSGVCDSVEKLPVMSPCLTGFFEYEGENLPEVFGVVGDSESELRWTHCENFKEGRIQAGSRVLVAHGSEAFSKEHLEKSSEQWLPIMQREVENKWIEFAELKELKASWGHRWRYAFLPSQVSLESSAPSQIGAGLYHVGSFGPQVIGESLEKIWDLGVQVSELTSS